MQQQTNQKMGEGLVSSDKKAILPLKNVAVQVKIKDYLVGISSTQVTPMTPVILWKCKATLTDDIIGKIFKFDVLFELTDGPSEEDVSVIHQFAVKKMIQEWQDDEPFEQRHKKEIIELSTDASVVSRYTAYIAVDVAQNKPVSGSMQSYELFAEENMMRKYIY